MAVVQRLMTIADADDADWGSAMSVSVRHEAELADGRTVPLLANRGWTSQRSATSRDAKPSMRNVSVEDIERTARAVVGPDEPPDGCSYEDMHAAHWKNIARILREQGVAADAAELASLPHDVVLSGRLRARLRS
ncbi:MAG TPA: hypothetical protein VF257_09505 [Solirubrobacteraceae bacterium]